MTVLLALALVLLAVAASAADFNKQLDIGDKAPAFADLEGTEGGRHALADFADSKLVVVAFTCNTCPMAKAYEERFIAFDREYQDQGVAFVAINCNPGPADALLAMKERAEERGFDFPYLADPGQNVGRAYGATVTPHLFVLDPDRRVAYMGAFDDKQDPAKAKRHYVRDAVEALLAGREPEITETRQFGCAIEYRKLAGDE
ncbi:MAG TPA: thioredoxin family protein [Planctomycetaceae bacterium]|nr:thioredoxin family protein [Planctomycetaceae bacterium]